VHSQISAEFTALFSSFDQTIFNENENIICKIS